MTEEHFYISPLNAKAAKFVPQKVEPYAAEANRSECDGRLGWHVMLFVLKFALKMAEQSGNVTVLCPGRGGFLLMIQTVCKCPFTSTSACCVSSFGIHKQL